MSTDHYTRGRGDGRSGAAADGAPQPDEYYAGYSHGRDQWLQQEKKNMKNDLNPIENAQLATPAEPVAEPPQLDLDDDTPLEGGVCSVDGPCESCQ